MGGSLVSLNNMPPWFKFISKITPNAWGLDGFSTLGLGGTLKDIVIPIFALLVMGAILFTIAVFLFNRLRITQQ
jgi:ABC-2 type transport system permease protein